MDHLTAERGRELFLTAFGNDPKVWADASPIYHVAAGKDIPPMLVFYVDRPRSAEVSRRFVQTLKKAGVPAAAIEARGKNHGSINRDIAELGDGETQIILEFLRGKSLSEMPGSF
jgi:acetyl esterase/lipase